MYMKAMGPDWAIFLKVSAANVLTKVRKLGNFLALFENISSKNENFDYIGNVL